MDCIRDCVRRGGKFTKLCHYMLVLDERSRHHDPGPNNVVFQGTRPIAFIDFDTIAPGERLEDLGYMAWSWCISAKTSRQPVEIQPRQVGILACAYDIDGVDRHNSFDSIVERQTRNIQFWLEGNRKVTLKVTQQRYSK
jgi:aminoglycoside phosphotransferase (APT) family kinase protein